MKKSKIFSVVLAMFLILTLNVGAVRAADTARIYLDAVQAKSGIVTVSCKAENVGKISNGKLRITYAADKLHLVKTEAGDGLKKGNFQTVINDPIDRETKQKVRSCLYLLLPESRKSAAIW